MDIEFVIIFIMLLIALIATLKKKSELNEYKENAAWLICKQRDFTVGEREYDYLSYVLSAQKQTKLNEKYHIKTEEEKEMAREILDEFRDEIIFQYFYGKLSFPKNEKLSKLKYRPFSNEDLLIINLEDFLSENSGKSYIGNNKMHEKSLYKYENGSHFGDYQYQLSDFGIVFFKLHYITNLYCQQSKTIFRLNYIDSIKKNLDTQEIWLHRR